MEFPKESREPTNGENRLAFVVFILCLAFNYWGVTVGWQNKNLPGVEFRQAQTALSTYWIHADNNFHWLIPPRCWASPGPFRWNSHSISGPLLWSAK